MKITKFPIIAFSLLILSCGSDDNNLPNIDESLLLGTWIIQDFQYEGTNN